VVAIVCFVSLTTTVVTVTGCDVIDLTSKQLPVATCVCRRRCFPSDSPTVFFISPWRRRRRHSRHAISGPAYSAPRMRAAISIQRGSFRDRHVRAIIPGQFIHRAKLSSCCGRAGVKWQQRVTEFDEVGSAHPRRLLAHSNPQSFDTFFINKSPYATVVDAKMTKYRIRQKKNNITYASQT